MATQLNDIVVLVNNQQIAYTSDTLRWVEGQGEYNVRNAIVGGGQTEQIFSQDLATKVGKVMFSLPTTEENDALKRSWKANLNQNVVELVGPAGTNFTKVFTQASIINDPECSAATDGQIEIEFSANPAQ